MKLKLLTLLCILSCFFGAQAQKMSKLKKAALQEAAALEPQVTKLSQELWNYSETALKEAKSAKLLIDVLKKEGFKLEENVAGMPTAFVATFGSGKPVIGILAEFDALPGVGNEPVPYKKKRADGVMSGQGCGHNLFGSASVNAAIALKRTMSKRKIKGTIKLFGTPAEETVVGKVYMAKDGVFNGLDAVIEWHPATTNGVNFGKSLAMNNFEVEFFGQSAHGAADPWNGRSALDGVEMMNYGVNLMREHVYPTTRIHYVIPNGGGAPNVVPDYAKVWYFVRDTSRANVEKFYQRIQQIAKGASIATNTTYKVRLITGVHAYNRNEPMMRAMEKNILLVGAPKFTEEEQAWGKKLQKSAGKKALGFKTDIKKIPSDWRKVLPSGGSTDVAEVSFITPTAGFGVATAPFGVPWHSWATSSSHGTSAGYKGALAATKILTLTGIDLLTDRKLLEAAKADFQKSTGGKAYQSPLPTGQQVILPKQK
ncbi:MAG TPA: amidohydrolase [Microscillaceae bacterium]|nr:amidohydrolase [Microscillaceae bacterium]